jgi:hypothetical protein
MLILAIGQLKKITCVVSTRYYVLQRIQFILFSFYPQKSYNYKIVFIINLRQRNKVSNLKINDYLLIP